MLLNAIHTHYMAQYLDKLPRPPPPPPTPINYRPTLDITVRTLCVVVSSLPSYTRDLGPRPKSSMQTCSSASYLKWRSTTSIIVKADCSKCIMIQTVMCTQRSCQGHWPKLENNVIWLRLWLLQAALSSLYNSRSSCAPRGMKDRRIWTYKGVPAPKFANLAFSRV